MARIIWSDHCDSLSPYRFCDYLNNPLQKNHHCSWNCDDADVGFRGRMYVLDFAGGGAVHLIGTIVSCDVLQRYSASVRHTGGTVLIQALCACSYHRRNGWPGGLSLCQVQGVER